MTNYRTTCFGNFYTGIAALLFLCASVMAEEPQANTNAVDNATQTNTTAAATQDKALIRVHAFISGRVQGVGFRAFTVQTVVTSSLNVTGWVKNLSDGRVELIVEGPKADIEKLMAAVAKGPAGSRVDKVDQKEETYTGEFKHFKIEN